MKNIYRHLYQDIYGFPSSAISFISASKRNLTSLLTCCLKIKFKNISSDSPAYLSPHPRHSPNIYMQDNQEKNVLKSFRLLPLSIYLHKIAHVCIPVKHSSFKICKSCKYLNLKIYRFAVMAYQYHLTVLDH